MTELQLDLNQQIEKLFSQALAWGMVYGPELSTEQWHEHRIVQAQNFRDALLKLLDDFA